MPSASRVIPGPKWPKGLEKVNELIQSRTTLGRILVGEEDIKAFASSWAMKHQRHVMVSGGLRWAAVNSVGDKKPS